MITELNSRSVTLLQTEAASLLRALAEKHGMTIRMAGGTFDVSKANLKFEFLLTGEDAEKKQFAKDAQSIGCNATDYGKTATINKETVTLIGFALNRRAFPVKVKKVDGSIVLMREDVLGKYFATGFDHMLKIQTGTVLQQTSGTA